MTETETLEILAVLKAAFPHSFKGLTKRDAKAMVRLWLRMFAADEYGAVNAAVEALISTRTTGFSPTVGEVKERLRAMSEPDGLSEQSAWALVSKACSNGLYAFRAEFEKLPPEVQRAVGAPEQLREWAGMDAETVQSVVASNFMRNYRTQKKRAAELKMLPPDLRGMIGDLADGMKLIEE